MVESRCCWNCGRTTGVHIARKATMTLAFLPAALRFETIGSCGLLLIILAATVFAQAGAGSMSAGIDAYDCGNYEVAIEHFHKALQLNPELTKAHLYLAHAYAAMYVPGADSAENLAFAEKSMAEFQRVLHSKPSPEQQTEVVRSLASINFSMKNFDLASNFYQQLLNLDPGDATAYFSLAVIDWMQAYKPDQELRSSMALKPTDEMPPGSACTELRSLNQERVDDGIRE